MVRTPDNQQEAHRMLANLGHRLMEAAIRLQALDEKQSAVVDHAAHTQLLDTIRQIQDVHRVLYPPPPDTQHYEVGGYFYSLEQGLRHNGWKVAYPSWATHHATTTKEK